MRCFSGAQLKISFYFAILSSPMLPADLAFVDVETTGGSFHHSRVIDIGIVRVHDGVVTQTFSSLINPDGYIPAEITAMTGISQQDVETAPSFRQIRDEVEGLLENCVFVAHNVQFDYGFLKSEFQYLGKSFQSKHFCTAKLSRLLYPADKRHNLDSVIERCGLSCSQRHRALPDAQALWDFYQHIQTNFPTDAVETAVQRALKAPSVPLKISDTVLQQLPESAGVYFFYGANDLPLYIGKSVHIKDRVRSHFSQSHTSPTEWKISQQVERIETIQTAGELGALLTEAGLIKQHQPLYNRKLRNAHQLVMAKKQVDDAGYWQVRLETTDGSAGHAPTDCVGVFRSKRQAIEFLREIAQDHGLCDRLLGLEKASGACFGYQLQRCSGACVGKEPSLRYNARLLSAVQTQMINLWPFPSPILLRESTTNLSYGYLFDQWCYLGTLREDEGAMRVKKEPEIRFDLDVYAILKRYLLNPKHARMIKQVPREQLGDLFAWEF